MPDDTPLKSAYELAMERLRAKDREAGVEQRGPLSEPGKTEIARLRAEAKAKLAELEILHEKEAVSVAGDPEKSRELERHYRIDRRRVESNLESAVAAVRRREEN